MNCPWCDFRFGALLANGYQIPAVAPVVCENCAELSLLLDGTEVRKATVAEIEALRLSPAWDFINHALTVIRSHIKARKAQYN